VIEQRFHMKKASDSQVSAHLKIGGDPDPVGVAFSWRPPEEGVETDTGGDNAAVQLVNVAWMKR
jgi:hypothetical protein